ncbi:hypothetical protein DPMN_050076 [Dreissena polymorpha]|uniref:Uncharacterized protein n=1 Tax=Dreissena polymorpha TaxID=45954 RepID=A0A9D4CGI6_DREPO|nr:hypothetical protein DPMN_050076 [Dreissena polymorpha]
MVLVNQGFEQRNTTTYDYEAMKNNAYKLRFGNFCKPVTTTVSREQRHQTAHILQLPVSDCFIP